MERRIRKASANGRPLLPSACYEFLGQLLEFSKRRKKQKVGPNPRLLAEGLLFTAYSRIHIAAAADAGFTTSSALIGPFIRFCFASFSAGTRRTLGWILDHYCYYFLIRLLSHSRESAEKSVQHMDTVLPCCVGFYIRGSI